MKIAMIGHKRIPSREGGVEIVVEELSTRLAKKGHQVTVFNRKGKNVQDKKADKNKKIKEYIINGNIDMEKIMNDFARIYIYDNKK